MLILMSWRNTRR